MFCVGGVHESVAEPIELLVTAIENGASEALALPSLALMTMFEYDPTLVAVGVPESCPVVVLKAAHDGLFVIAKLNASPSASAAVGRKLYAAPAFTDAAGEPLIVGARFAGAVTLIAKAGNAVVALPSLTLIAMLE